MTSECKIPGKLPVTTTSRLEESHIIFSEAPAQIFGLILSLLDLAINLSA